MQGVINNSILLMKEHCEKTLQLSQLANHVSMSPSHFSLVFKKSTGVSPINYYNTLKIQKACEYLKFTNLLVKEIAFKVGVSDVQYFTKLFSKIMGTTPFKYRKQ